MLHLTSALPEWSSWPNDGDDESPVPCVMRIVRGQMRTRPSFVDVFSAAEEPPLCREGASGVWCGTPTSVDAHHLQVSGFSFWRCRDKLIVDFLDNKVPSVEDRNRVPLLRVM